MILCMWEALITPGLIGKMAFDKDDNIAMRWTYFIFLLTETSIFLFNCTKFQRNTGAAYFTLLLYVSINLYTIFISSCFTMMHYFYLLLFCCIPFQRNIGVIEYQFSKISFFSAFRRTEKEHLKELIIVFSIDLIWKWHRFSPQSSHLTEVHDPHPLQHLTSTSISRLLFPLRFVCAASNLRSNVFGIKPMNFYDSKVSTPKNIIPWRTHTEGEGEIQIDTDTHRNIKNTQIET
jgi:hypothetical protein